MRYKSTRGGISGLKFSETLLMGLAPDGGLLVPESIPDIQDNLALWKKLSFVELAKEVIGIFADDISKDVLDPIVERAYSDRDNEMLSAQWQACLEYSALEELPNCERPLHVIAFDQDMQTPPARGKIVSDAASDGHFHLLKDPL